MPRPRALIPTIEVKAYLTAPNAAELKLLCHSEALGRPIHGEASRILNEALSLWLKVQKGELECTPRKQMPV
jgi:hypothetical protein